MLNKIDELCAERDRLKGEMPGPSKGRVLGGRIWRSPTIGTKIARGGLGQSHHGREHACQECQDADKALGRCSIVDAAGASANIRAMLQGNMDEGPVMVAMFDPSKSDRPNELFIACQEDLQERCQGDPMRATDLQFMYADVLRAVLAIALGGDIEAEVLRPKIISIMKRTIQ